MESVHKTVLLKKTIDELNLKPGAKVIDCTLGGGGHSLEICTRDQSAKIIALDQDKDAFSRTKSKFESLNCNVVFINQNFSNLKFPSKTVDGIIFDLGLSSDQLEKSGRGFSFQRNEPLLMTMKSEISEEDITAREIVNNWEEQSIADVLYGYGEERYARRIAREIVSARRIKRIDTTSDLIKIIERAVPVGYRRRKIHFATKSFQALRIAVNDELQSLQKGLERGFELLKINGRMAIISFHSLEDRIVKKFFREKEKEKRALLINKKPILPEKEEIKNNPRSRSAKLRVLERIK